MKRLILNIGTFVLVHGILIFGFCAFAERGEPVAVPAEVISAHAKAPAACNACSIEPKTCVYNKCCGDDICGSPCIKSTAEAAVGASHVACYMKLFRAETGCRWLLGQKKGHAGNPHAGFGICTLEVDPNLRTRRGKNCQGSSSDFSLLQQMKCCQSIWINSRSYFGHETLKKVGSCS